MLRIKKLDPNAILPTVGHPGEDLGFDICALKDTVLVPGKVTAVETGIAARFTHMNSSRKFGLIIKDRSSMAAKGIVTSAGVIDAGYTGEIKVLMTNNNSDHTHQYCGLYGYDTNPDYTQDTETRFGYLVGAGAKIAQMVPIEIHTDNSIVEMDELMPTSRGDDGFGSTGQ